MAIPWFNGRAASETVSQPSHHHHRLLPRFGVLAGLLLGTLLGAGCADLDGGLSVGTVSRMSPAPQVMDAGQAMREARAYAIVHPGAQVILGSGDSMLPYYRDNTVIVIERRPLEELSRGMTVVYLSSQGWPVAHALVEKGGNGWSVKGLNNPDCDPDRVTEGNYAGVVVRAYQSTSNPMLALSRELSTETDTENIALGKTTGAGGWR
jgi:hypothetical protein